LAAHAMRSHLETVLGTSNGTPALFDFGLPYTWGRSSLYSFALDIFK